MCEKSRISRYLSAHKRIIAVIVAAVLLFSNASAGVFASAYTATIGTYAPRISFFYDDTELDVQYCTTIGGSYTTINSGFSLSSGVNTLYFKIIGTSYTDVLRDGIAISKDLNNIFTIDNITSNTSITIGTIVNLDVSFGSIVIGNNNGAGGRQYTYSDSSGAKTGNHYASNIYIVTGEAGTADGGGNKNIALTGAGDFNVFLSGVTIYTGKPGNQYVGLGTCAPVSTSGVTGEGNINITLVGTNRLENVSENPSNSYAALEKNYSYSTLIINGDGTLYATGGADSAGIGCSDVLSEGTKNITINDGTIVATTNGSQGAGIGSGNNKCAENICIYGGNITATGVSNGAGIGGSGSVSFVGESGEVFIYGGTITATSNGTGAGIGGGGSGDTASSIGGAGNVYIYGGTINTDSIGGGSGGASGGAATVSIFGGKVSTSENIGGGNSAIGSGGTANITISGGTISAANISGGHGFSDSHAGGTLNVTGGTAKAEHVCNQIIATGIGNGSVIPYTVAVTTNGTTPVANTLVTGIVFNPALADYGVTDMYTNAEGKLYLWLPSGTTVESVTTGGSPYSGTNIVQQSASITASPSTIAVGTVLTAVFFSDTTASSWQWQQYTGSEWANISGETGDTYTVTAANLGKQLLVIINGTYSLPVYVPAPSSFVVTIPESIQALTENGGFSIKANRYYFESTDKLTVTCSGDFKLELTDAAAPKLDYTLYTNAERTDAVISGGIIGTFVGSGSSIKSLYYSITGTPIYSGTYTDILTFTVAMN